MTSGQNNDGQIKLGEGARNFLGPNLAQNWEGMGRGAVISGQLLELATYVGGHAGRVSLGNHFDSKVPVVRSFN